MSLLLHVKEIQAKREEILDFLTKHSNTKQGR